MTECGCRPVACAAFIGEHSYSHPEAPVAEGRPDVGDLQLAASLGRKVGEKLGSVGSGDRFPEPRVPGIRPYRGDPRLWTVDFVAVGDACGQCGVCAGVCPTGAIDRRNSLLTDIDACITCCACIKRCPNHARTMKAGPVKEASIRLHALHRERKEPELFV